MINRGGSTATWSSYNYPTAISASDATGSEEVQFTYGPDRQRVEQIYTSPSGTEQTYYIGGLIDLVFNGTTNYRQYIYAGPEPIAVYSRTGAGVNTMSYMLEDHQGGISAIASNSGATDVDESFSTFGARRSPTTWSGAPTTADLNSIASLSRQGYTFQTSLGQSMGLNHMNGRVQDTVLGRFLSPDPHITDPTNSQSYNRYSYVNNNPLTYVDPTGFDAAGDGWQDNNPASWDPFYQCFGNCGGGGTAALTSWYNAESGAISSAINSAFGGGDALGDGTSSSPFSPNYSSTQSAQSQGSGSTVWGDGNGGFTDASAGVTVCASCVSTSGSEAASTVMGLAGAGAAGIEAQWGGSSQSLLAAACIAGLGRMERAEQFPSGA